MPRPLMRHNIAQLEELFVASKADEMTLKKLEHELGFRQVPRAVALLTKVQGTLHGAAGASQALPPPAELSPRPKKPQPELWDSSPAPAIATATPSAPVPPAVRIAPTATAKPATAPAEALNPTSGPAIPVPVMSINDAYKVMKATAGSTWGAIEQTRRQLVQQAHPERVATMSAEQRAQVQAEAKRANIAYAVLLAVRVS